MSRFETTRWSLVLQARAAEPEARVALEALCRSYRPPVLAYIRGRGYAPEDAEDLAQTFFARLVEHDWHASADSARGRFRTFILTVLKRFLSDDAARLHARKRGGDMRFESFDTHDAQAVADQELPEHAFERAWALAVLHSAIARLQDEAQQSGKEDLFLALREFLIEPPDDADYARAADKLGLRRNTLAVAVHRMRHRLRELVQAELEQTTANPEDYDREMHDLGAALGAAMNPGGSTDARA
jgi:RNA polymerase sigma-70 factor (ECF subfamily)